MSRDLLTIAGRDLPSRLLVGTGGLPSLDILERVLKASGTALTTVAMRRVRPSKARRMRSGTSFARSRVSSSGCASRMQCRNR